MSKVKLARALLSSDHEFMDNEVIEYIKETTDEYESDLKGSKVYLFRQTIGDLKQELEEHEFEWLDESEWNVREIE